MRQPGARLWLRASPTLFPLFAATLLAAPRTVSAQGIPVTLGVDRFGVEDGLPGLFVPDLDVTEDGRLWILASGRMAAFDGFTFEEHAIEQVTEWSGGSLVGIGAGRGDTVWVTVGESLLTHVRGRTTLAARHKAILRDVLQDREGTIWARDDRGIVRLAGIGFERVVLFAREDSVLSDVHPDEPWLADTRWGPTHLFRASEVLSPRPLPDALPAMGNPGGLMTWNPVSGVITGNVGRERRFTLRPGGASRRPLLVDHRGYLWVAAPGRIEAINESGETVASLPIKPDASVSSVREDREGNIWIGTVTDGLYRVRQLPVRVVGARQGLTDGQVLRVSDGGDGGVLVVDQEGWVWRLRMDSRVDTVFAPGSPSDRAISALVDRAGTTWVATTRPGGGMLLGQANGGRSVRIPLEHMVPLRMAEDPNEDGLLWLAGGGAYRLRPRAPNGPELSRPLLPASWGAREVILARDGAAWVAGPLGVARIAGEVVREFLATDGYPTGNARALYEDSDATIWIGRYGGGLVRYRNGMFDEVRATDGLWDDVVSSLLEDDAGSLWMGSNRGVHRVSRRNVDTFLAGRTDRVQGRGYGASSGFVNPEASGWHGYRSSDGRMWFPTFSGVAVVDPAVVRAQELAAPGIRIRGVRIADGVAQGDSLSLPRGDRRFDVAYGAIALSFPEDMRYQVRLDGVDRDWVDVGGQRLVTYGNVPPGRHAFRVRAVSGAGATSTNEALVVVEVPPLFRETWIFYVLVSVAVAFLAAGGHRVRTRQLREREATLHRLVRERTHDLAESQARIAEALDTVASQANELRSLDEAKSRFFANVSHELRTPLTLVQGPLQDVLDGRLGPMSTRVREQVATVLASGKRLGELVEQLLDVARLESGELVMNIREEDISPLLGRLAGAFGALARSRRIEFVARLPDGHVVVAIDADQFEKVLGNLLSNALKFTPEGGRVRFDVEPPPEDGSGDLVATVEDDGIGIPEQERERVFERFHQADDSSRRRYGGAGLGLALVKEITELHGGSVDVRSEPGRGSLFTVRIPARRRSTHGAPSLGQPSSARNDEGVPAAADPAQVPPATPGSSDAERPTVLVVEDHEELRAYLRRHLEDHYRVVEANDGVEGLAAARRTAPDLILCDIMMPVMDGEALCRAIRIDPDLNDRPVIIVSARASRESRLSAFEGGADDYLVKPFDPEELRLRVHNVLASRRRLLERFRAEGKSLAFVPFEAVSGRTGKDGFSDRFAALLREQLGNEDLDAEGMGKALAMSRATLYRKAQQALQESPMEALWRYRLRQAAHWLRTTDATVSEVAYACGFKTVPHFTRRFREMFTTTPGAYRRSDPEDG